MGLREKLLQAFAVEHQELLARIREVLDRLADGESPPTARDWAEAYRAAHSLKGASRVCDLPGIQIVGTHLQSILGRVRDGLLTLSKAEVRVIREALDGVELAARAGVAGGPVPDISSAAAAVERILPSATTEKTKTAVEREKARSPRAMADRLLAAFATEQREHLEFIRAILGRLEGQADPVLDPAQINEVFRRAHSLKGAARVNDLPAIQRLAHSLETVFARVRDGALPLVSETLRIIHRGLDAIEDAGELAAQRKPAPDTTAACQAIESLVGSGETRRFSAPVPVADWAVTGERGSSAVETEETVRINARALDRILNTAGQLVTECFQQEGLGADLNEVRRLTAELGADRKAIPVGRWAGGVTSEGEGASGLRDLTRQVGLTRRRHQAGSWTLARLAGELRQNVREARFVPAAAIFQGFRKLARDVAADEGKEVEVQVTGLEVEADRLVLQALKDPVMHLLRNAVSHGIQKPAARRAGGKASTGQVALRIGSDGNRLLIRVEDDGAGIDVARVTEIAVKRGFLSEGEAAACSAAELTRLIFHSNFSTSRVITEISGRGVGLSVVNTAVMRLGGEVSVEARPAGGTCFRVSVPLTLATRRLVMARCRGQEFGLPFTAVESILQLRWKDVRTIEGHPHLVLEQETVPLTSLEAALHFPEAQIRLDRGRAQVAVIRGAGRRLALTVDGFSGARDTIVKDLPPPAVVNPRVSGAIVTEQGGVALVLNPTELIQSHAPAAPQIAGEVAARAQEAARHTVLVVDDSFTARTLEKSLLEAHGYQVLVAVDGVEGLARLRAERVDLAIIDVEMPRMDGFTMLQELKADERLKCLPVIMVTSIETRSDIERGLNLGAEAYIVKRKFDHQELLNTIQQIL